MGKSIPEVGTDPRLDANHWHVFGRRLPRRFSVYARVFAAILLILFLGWWFTRDVTYVSNVKVSGLDATRVQYREPLREYADDLAGVVNRLADRGFGWRSGSLPSFRTADALSQTESREVLALGTVEVRKSGDTVVSGPTARDVARFLQDRGWLVKTGPDGVLNRAEKELGPLHAVLRVEQRTPYELITIRVSPPGYSPAPSTEASPVEAALSSLPSASSLRAWAAATGTVLSSS